MLQQPGATGASSNRSKDWNVSAIWPASSQPCFPPPRQQGDRELQGSEAAGQAQNERSRVGPAAPLGERIRQSVERILSEAPPLPPQPSPLLEDIYGAVDSDRDLVDGQAAGEGDAAPVYGSFFDSSSVRAAVLRALAGRVSNVL